MDTINELLVPAAPIHAASVQASSDHDMIALWLGTFRSPHTRRGYAIDIRVFLSFAPKPLHAVTVRDLQAFALTLLELADATQARRLAAVKSLIALAHRLGYLPFDVGAPVQLPAIKDTLAERIMTEEQTLRMLGAVKSQRNAALLRLIYGAGLRISEACGLRWRDLAARDDAGQITVFGKGGKTRVVLLPKHLWARLIALQSGHAAPDQAIFRSRRGGDCLQPRQVHEIVKIAARRAGLSPDVSCHWLRHAHASHSLDRGCPVHILQTTLGHASLTTTSRYVHVRPGDSSARYLAS